MAVFSIETGLNLGCLEKGARTNFMSAGFARRQQSALLHFQYRFSHGQTKLKEFLLSDWRAVSHLATIAGGCK